MLGGPQSLSTHGVEEKNSQPLPGFEPSITQPVPLSYPGSSVPGGGWEFLSSTPCPDRLWGLMGTGGSYPGGTVPNLRMRGAIPPIPQYVFMVWCLIKPRDSVTIILSFKPEGKRPTG